MNVFKENSIFLRNSFFSDTLVKYLWSQIFIIEAPETTIAHLRRIRSMEHHGEVKYEKMLGDMLQLEVNCNCQILPDAAKNYEANKVFTTDEKKLDLFENLKYHRR